MNLDYFRKKYKNWHYKNLTLLGFSIILIYFFAETQTAERFILSIETLGYLGVFITGIFFVSIFTVTPSAIILFKFTEIYSIQEIALIAGLGGLVGDLIIFRVLKNNIFKEIQPLIHPFLKYPGKIFKTPFFFWLPAVLGAILVASPLPDEIGVGLLGISKLKTWQFSIIALVLDIAGIYVLLTITKAL